MLFLCLVTLKVYNLIEIGQHRPDLLAKIYKNVVNPIQLINIKAPAIVSDENCIFKDIYCSPREGGVININEKCIFAQITNCSFISCKGKYGNAIYSGNGASVSLYIRECLFIDCTQEKAGYVVYSQSNDVIIEGNEFNFTNYKGGAIFLRRKYSIFKRNKFNRCGGKVISCTSTDKTDFVLRLNIFFDCEGVLFDLVNVGSFRIEESSFHYIYSAFKFKKEKYDGIEFRNCTFMNCGKSGFVITTNVKTFIFENSAIKFIEAVAGKAAGGIEFTKEANNQIINSYFIRTFNPAGAIKYLNPSKASNEVTPIFKIEGCTFDEISGGTSGRCCFSITCSHPIIYIRNIFTNINDESSLPKYKRENGLSVVKERNKRGPTNIVDYNFKKKIKFITESPTESQTQSQSNTPYPTMTATEKPIPITAPFYSILKESKDMEFVGVGWGSEENRHWTTVIGDYAQCAFTGITFWIYGTIDPGHGIMIIELDGIIIAQTNLNSEERKIFHPIYVSRKISYGEHIIKMINEGTDGNGNGGKAIEVICIYYHKPPTSTAKLISVEELTYSGSWHDSETGKWTTAVGSECEIAYVGSKFWIYGTKDPTHGKVNIYLDNEFVIEQSGLGSRENNVEIYNKKDIDYGEHIIKLILTTTGGFEISCFYYEQSPAACETLKETPYPTYGSNDFIDQMFSGCIFSFNICGNSTIESIISCNFSDCNVFDSDYIFNVDKSLNFIDCIFNYSDNTIQMAAIKFNYEGDFNIINCKFIRCSGNSLEGHTIFSEKEFISLKISNTLFDECSQNSKDNIAEIYGNNILIENSLFIFKNLTSKSCNAIQTNIISKLEILNCVFNNTNNAVNKYKTENSLNIRGETSIKNSTFLNCGNKEYVIKIKQQLLLFDNNSIVFKDENRSCVGIGIFESENIMIYSSKFQKCNCRNIGDGGAAIYFDQSNINKINNFELFNTVFNDLYGDKYQCFSLEINSENLNIENVTFSHIETNHGVFRIRFEDNPGSYYLKACIFHQVKYISFFKLENTASVIYSDCQFINVIYTSENYFNFKEVEYDGVEFRNCTFMNCGKSGFVITTNVKKFIFQNSSIKFDEAISGKAAGGIEFTKEANNQIINSYIFRTFKSDGAIKYLNPSKASNEVTPIFKIEGCTFDETSGGTSGRSCFSITCSHPIIYIRNTIQNIKDEGYTGLIAFNRLVSEFKIENCSFINKASTIDYCGGYGLWISQQENSSRPIINIKYENCIWEYNYIKSSSGGAVHHGKAANLCNASMKFVNCTFRNNRAKNEGGAVALQIYQEASFEDCKFYNNIAESGKGGAIFVDPEFVGHQSANIMKSCLITNCLFEGNSAKDNGHALYIRGTETEYTITDTNKFKNNGNSNSLILSECQKLNYFMPSIEYTDYINAPRAFEFSTNSYAIFEKHIFQNYRSNENEGNAILISKGCKSVSFIDCKFIDCGNGNQGYVLTINDGEIYIDKCVFEFDTPSQACCALKISVFNKVTIQNCLFKQTNNRINSSMGSFHYQPSNGNPLDEQFIFSSNVFDNCVGYSFRTYLIEIQNEPIFSNITIRNIQDGDLICGLLLNKINSFTFDHCSFINISSIAEYGGGSGMMLLKQGGGYYKTIFLRCLWENNYAEENDDSNGSNELNGIGGGFQHGYKNSTLNTELTFSHCKFIKNKSDKEGGALAIKTTNSCVIDNCIFENNIAGYAFSSGKPNLSGEIGKGGAIYIFTEYNSETLLMTQIKIIDSVFRSNQASDGHAIYIRKSEKTTIE